MSLIFYVAAAFTMLTFTFFILTLKNFKHAMSSVTYDKVIGNVVAVYLGGKYKNSKTDLMITYEYAYHNHTFTGTKTAFYTIYYPQTALLASAHPVGSKIDVFVDPSHPKRCVLITGARKNKPYFDLVIAGFTHLVSFLILIGVILNQ
jgi:hypothetical protein